MVSIREEGETPTSTAFCPDLQNERVARLSTENRSGFGNNQHRATPPRPRVRFRADRDGTFQPPDPADSVRVRIDQAVAAPVVPSGATFTRCSPLPNVRCDHDLHVAVWRGLTRQEIFGTE